MPRTGAELKPPWQRVPRAVRRLTEQTLGGRVARAARIWGGYGPSATFRIRLADGRRAFFKGVNRDSNEYMRWALGREERVYRQLSGLIVQWVPAFLGAFKLGDWHVLLLEDLGPADVPPWTVAKARTAARAYAEFHCATLGQAIPRWVPRRRMWARFGLMWGRLAEEPGGLDGAAALAGERAAEARSWLDAALPVLRNTSEALTVVRPAYALLHLDTRSDNIRILDGRLRIFDWPNACAGPVEFDAAAFAQSVTCEGGPAPEQLIAWYAERLPLREAVLDRAVAAIAGYFANVAWRQPIPGLPRVRSIQRRQLCTSLAWAARRLNLLPPEWLGAVPP